jgi:tetratricopeptide (TPR) repeat protein
MSASSNGALRSAVALQLAAWSLEEGNRDDAKRHAGEAARSAQGAQGRAQAQVYEILAEEPAPADVWRARFEKALPGAPGGVDSLVAFGLLVSRRFTDAIEPLRRILSRTPAASDGSARTLLAWALTETGNTKEAGELLDRWPMPDSQQELKVDWLEFPRSLYLRGLVAESRSDQARARRHYELFLKLAAGRYAQETSNAKQRLSR